MQSTTLAARGGFFIHARYTKPTMNTHSKLVSWSLIIGIVIVLNLFFNYAISLVYQAPEYENYCKQEQIVTQPQTAEECTTQGGQWSEPDPRTTPVYDAAGNPMKLGYCDTTFTCRGEYEDANQTYQRTVFITLVVLGVIVLIAGMFIGNNLVLSTSLAWGGVLSLVIASMRYWSSADNLLKVIILAVALAALIFMAVKKFSNSR